eukprot:SAG11_NODE_942_length_6435_cov_27.522096_7_plen_208_part_00
MSGQDRTQGGDPRDLIVVEQRRVEMAVAELDGVSAGLVALILEECRSSKADLCAAVVYLAWKRTDLLPQCRCLALQRAGRGRERVEPLMSSTPTLGMLPFCPLTSNSNTFHAPIMAPTVHDGTFNPHGRQISATSGQTVLTNVCRGGPVPVWAAALAPVSRLEISRARERVLVPVRVRVRAPVPVPVRVLVLVPVQAREVGGQVRHW